MRSIWKGAIAFGLVNVPVKLYSATEDHDVSLHQVHDKDGGRIRYQRRCEICGEVVDYEHIDKAYDAGDRTVILTDEDLQSLPEGRSREIDVVEFVPSEQVDPIMFDRSYFLEPDSKSIKAYALLRRTLEETDRTAIVHFALRQKTRLAALRVHGDVLVLQTLLWDDEVRKPEFPSLDQSVTITDKELQMSSALVDSFADDFTPEKFNDDYQIQLRELIDAKLEQGDALDTAATFGEEPAEKTGGEVIDLMEALRRSVEKNRTSRTSAADTEAADDAEEDADVAEASEHPKTRGGKSASAKRETGTAKRETGTAKRGAGVASRGAGAKSAPAKSAGAKSAAAKSPPTKSAGSKSAAKSAPSKSAAATKKSDAAKSAKSTTARSTTARSATVKSTTAKSTAAKSGSAESPATKAASKRRTVSTEQRERKGA